jgi:DNA-binding protein WhiA
MEKFSQLVRDENTHSELVAGRHCIKAELAAIIHMIGSLHLAGQQQLSLSVSTVVAGVARRMVKLIKASYGLESEVRVEQREQLGKQHRYKVIIPGQNGLEEMIVDLGMMTRERSLEAGINPALVKNNCCRAAFLRGAFLAGGSITDPHKKTYHLEMVTQSEDFANGLVYLMNLLGLKAKISSRKGHYLIYLKEIEALIKFLSVIGAHAAVLKLEEVRVVKGLRGEVNRRLNWETANLEKTLSAAMEQVKEIEAIQTENGGLSKLPAKLRETADLRLQYPEASLKELGEYHQPPISKSAVNHRLRLIRQYGKNFT